MINLLGINATFFNEVIYRIFKLAPDFFIVVFAGMKISTI